jgi:hypothetical protein
LGGGVEADRGAGDEHLAGGLGSAGVGAGGEVGGTSLPAVLELGEHERERRVGLRVPIGVDIDPVDPVGVKLRFHQERRHRAHAGRVRVQIDDQHGRAGIARCREDEQIREV